MGYSIGDRIKLARESAGLDMVQLAKLVGVTKQAVWGWESGATKGPRPEHLLALRDVLNVSLDWLVLGIGEMTPSATRPNLTEHHIKLIEFYESLPESERKAFFQSLQEKKQHYEEAIAEYLKRTGGVS